LHRGDAVRDRSRPAKVNIYNSAPTVLPGRRLEIGWICEALFIAPDAASPRRACWIGDNPPLCRRLPLMRALGCAPSLTIR